jgi:hypothetical protein
MAIKFRDQTMKQLNRAPVLRALRRTGFFQHAMNLLELHNRRAHPYLPLAIDAASQE